MEKAVEPFDRRLTTEMHVDRKFYGRAVVALLGLAGAWMVPATPMRVVAQSSDDISASIVRITTSSRQGTGVVVALDNGGATILTASHVLLGAQEYEVMLPRIRTGPGQELSGQPARMGTGR